MSKLSGESSAMGYTSDATAERQPVGDGGSVAESLAPAGC